MILTKAKRRRIWRMLKIQNWPFNHLSRDGMDDLFKDELRLFFSEYGIEFDERYVWD